MHWLSSHLFLFFSWLDVRPVCVYIASLWLFTWNISPPHLSLHDCSSYSSIWQSFSLPPFLLPLILIHNLARHSFPYLSCLSSFLPAFQIGQPSILSEFTGGHTASHIFPLHFRSTRIYWSMSVPMARTLYLFEVPYSCWGALSEVTTLH